MHRSASSSSFRLGVILAIFAATGFSCKAIFAKLAYRHGTDAITLVCLRMLFVLLILASYSLWRSKARLAGRDYLALIGLGLLGYYLSSVLDFIGLTTVSASLERLILGLYPTLTVLFSVVLTGTVMTRRMKQALPLTYLGIALVIAPGLAQANADWVGIGFIMASTTCYALYMSLSPVMISRIGAMRFTELGLTVSSIAVLCHFLITHPLNALIQPLPVYSLAAAMAVFATILPIYATAAAMSRIGASRTAIIGSLGPMLSILMSIGILDERLTAIQWLGAALVMLGVWVVSRKS
ncbi:DMT family transporter [Iodobacter sp. HSC-16F04]|uniref:DMT family transporter n=1 Tax=Iodobacter violaceini TaxID=3044271 RepID=A0ABX0KQS1_9NEIS|nr:DMT family transporter [Iodobacter violacea]NHQ86951.1 DMT family transporter [Iodobacter violacea]